MLSISPLIVQKGQELPQRGRCKHYAKSYRWFRLVIKSWTEAQLLTIQPRFSCCQRVFACDKCHDEASDHPEEHANRMLWYDPRFHSSMCRLYLRIIVIRIILVQEPRFHDHDWGSLHGADTPDCSCPHCPRISPMHLPNTTSYFCSFGTYANLSDSGYCRSLSQLCCRCTVASY